MKTLSKQHFFLLLSLYITQFLGLSFFTEAFIAILRKNGMPLENLGIVYMLGLFWVIRFLWAPIIDKINIKKIGHYRFWLILAQVIMTISLISTSFLDINKELNLILLFAIVFSFFSATQDIALDALVYKTLNKYDRPLGNAIKVSGGLIGTVIGGGVALTIYSYIGWQKTLLLLVFFTLIAVIQLLIFKEPIKDKKAERKVFVLKEFYNFWKSKNRKVWLIFIFLFPSAIGSAHGIISPILVDSNWALKDIGIIVHIFGYSLGIIASFITPWLIKKIGKKKVLNLCAIGQSTGILLLLTIIHGYSSQINVILIIGIIFLFYTPGMTVISTLMMDEIDSDNPASQYAIQHSVFMFSGLIFASLSVLLSGSFGYENIIIVIALISVIPLFLSFKIDKYLKNHLL